MPAERTVDQRLDALERRVAAPEREEAQDHVTQSKERPPAGDARTTGSTARTVRPREREHAGPTDQTSEATPSNGTGDAPAGVPGAPDTRSMGQSSTSNDDASTAHPTDIEGRLDDIEAELAELQAGMQALRGYVGNVDHVNESVERRANAALAAVERLEAAPTTPPSLAQVPAQPDEAADSEAADAGGVTATASENAQDEPGLLERLTDLG